MPKTASSVALSWVDAVNSHDAERLVSQSSREIEIAGPRGSAFGHQVLRDWLTRAGLTLETRRVFARGDNVVLDQQGIWHSPETGEVVGGAGVACCFQIADGLVARFARFDSLKSALQQASLSLTDEVPLAG